MEEAVAYQQSLFDDLHGIDMGTIDIRVTVLPAKSKKKDAEDTPVVPLDAASDEQFALDKSLTPLGSYLETSKGGKRCCVFLVNGQRQESLDNTFIIQELGFKYLRNRMMIAVDVDGLAQSAIGRLMQGSRQGFYRGDVWNAMQKRIIATLKQDPDLVRLEEEAERQVSELSAGDEKVKNTLDQLINSHHDHGWHNLSGAGAAAGGNGDDLGQTSTATGGVVVLLQPDRGAIADFPVLISKPSASAIRLQPNHPRDVIILSQPAGHWSALAQFDVLPDRTVPELEIKKERLDDRGKISLLFREKPEVEADYPIRATLTVTATFNGIKEPRQLEMRVVVAPERPAPVPILLDVPTKLRVTSRLPIRVQRGAADTHVGLRWDGKDQLLSGDPAAWHLKARLIEGAGTLKYSFSDPTSGRFGLLISPDPIWNAGDSLWIEVTAIGPNEATLSTDFLADVVEAPEKPIPLAPRLIDSNVPFGSIRRPPYDLRYITRDDYSEECWGGKPWTDDDPGYFREPTDKAPLILIINTDMAVFKDYNKFLVAKGITEGEIDRRRTKYNSHVAYHLYQMYQSTLDDKEGDFDSAEERRRAEIQRVAMTLVKLMEVSR
ncbi:hypothetical protein [Mesorhizobium sp. M00.F.Ca.ET.216.01.1.1]|uniref:hypothetical protein n=1 Tax=Mesorhizobium sp. M00.F.Ca.ET.216.01.1.1 TaxID=2500528 RepID=UPI000FDB781D|nr:hypothetical protein [Mesorhizobium sp. M00.F.Ca.ET.216.01.1.1]TGQ36509.1 hypothetical protein EN859_021870 [Mesorhizobium sp. M00.F.Ca.ET.216.01.1.1]